MNLIQALARTPLRWTLECAETASTRNSVVMRMTVIAEPGATPVTRDFALNNDLQPEGMMSLLLKQYLPKHPVLREWLDSRGNVPVELESEILDSVSECMHTALRKLADSKQSSIAWNALHHLHPSDWAALWDGVRQVLTDAYAPWKPVTRHALATALRDKVIAVTDERRFQTRVPDDEGELVERKKLQSFSLLMLHLGCELTEMNEWMWAWLGYVVKDVEASSVATEPDAPT